MQKKYILIIPGTNSVAYNIAAAFEGSAYTPVAVFPKGPHLPFRMSRKFGLLAQSRYLLNDAQYKNDLKAFVEGLGVDGEILTFLSNDEGINFWINECGYFKKLLTIQNEHIERMFNKRLLYTRLRELAIPIPRTWEPSASDASQLPFLIKSADHNKKSSHFKQFSSSVHLVTAKDALARVHAVDNKDAVCQEFVDFKEGTAYSWWGYRNKKGEVSSVVVKHSQMFPDRFGRIARLAFVDNTQVKKSGDALVGEFNLVGCCDIQFIFNAALNIHEVIDFNARPCCGYEMLLMNGVNWLKKCAEEYYGDAEEGSLAVPPDLVINQKEWGSVMANTEPLRMPFWRSDEFFGLQRDAILFRFAVRAFLIIKFLYGFIMRKNT